MLPQKKPICLGISTFQKSVNIGVKQWPTTQIYWLTNHQNILKLYSCSKTDICHYQTTLTANLRIHEETCSSETLIKAEQVPYGKPQILIDELISNGILSEDVKDFYMKHFVVYDIEVVQVKNEEETKLNPISIGVASTFSEDRYFERKSSLPNDGDKMINDFMNYLLHLNAIYQKM